MRALTLIVLTLCPLQFCPLQAQFKSTVPLVISPATITDSKGRFIDGLTDADLTLYDNNVPQTIQVEPVTNPISLVVVIEANSASEAVLDKLRGAGPLFADLLAADAGETAIISFSSESRVKQDFTADSRQLTRTLHNLRVQGDSCALLDGIHDALRLLAPRGAVQAGGLKSGRRPIILVIAERRDRSSHISLTDLLHDAQLQNTAVYWLTYSTFLTQFTNRPKTAWDRMTDEQKADPIRMQGKIKYPWPEEENPVPLETAPGNLFNVFTELAHKNDADAANILTQNTGGRTFNFLKQSGLEEAIHAVADEVHRQYVISFQPAHDTPGVFHSIRATVKDRPELQVRTRAGYWQVQ